MSAKLRRVGPERYESSDGRYRIERDFFVSSCDCPRDLCRHSGGDMYVYRWFVYDTQGSKDIDIQGLPDAVFEADTLRECRVWLG